MPFVLDASLTMTWCFEEESTSYTRQVLASLLITHAEVPALWTFEVANVLNVCERKRRITSSISDAFVGTLAGLDIRVQPLPEPASGRALMPLVRQYGLTAYDAAYLELARRKGLPLATLDTDLIRAAPQANVLLFQL